MDKAERKVQTDVFVAGINIQELHLGEKWPNITVYNSSLFSVGGSLLNDLTDTDTTTPTLATSLSNTGDIFQEAAFAFGRLYGQVGVLRIRIVHFTGLTRIPPRLVVWMIL